MNIDRQYIENKIAELETAKTAKGQAEGSVFLAKQELKKAEDKVETLTSLVKGLKLSLAELEYEETGCRKPSLHWQLDNSDCECKTTYFKQSAENWICYEMSAE